MKTEPASFVCITPLSFLILVFLIGTAEAQLNPTPMMPRNRAITAFGYGPVTQFLTSGAGSSGTSQCKALNRNFKCLSVSGGTSCTSPVPISQLVSCGLAIKPQVNETKFQPVNCFGHMFGDGGASGLLGNNDFCLAANYMPSRITDTLYQFNDYVRLGVNRRFGGAIFELYGSDKIDRILQNSGGGMQLSLWAYNPQYASPAYARAWYAIPSKTSAWQSSCNPTPYPTQPICASANPGLSCQYGVSGPNTANCKTVFACANEGQSAGAPLDPLQAADSGCNTGTKSNYVDSVASPAPGQITISKSNIFNYTLSSAFPGLNWQQTTQVKGPCAEVTYTMTNPGNASDSDFQEIPAVILHGGLNAKAYYYTGTKPYVDVAGPVSAVSIAKLTLFQLPNRPGPFGAGASAFLTEDWISTCDSDEVSCYTIASFSPISQDFVIAQPSDNPYAGIHGFFSITNQLNKSATVFVCPYRFDDVVEGETVRQFIYDMHNQALARAER